MLISGRQDSLKRMDIRAPPVSKWHVLVSALLASYRISAFFLVARTPGLNTAEVPLREAPCIMSFGLDEIGAVIAIAHDAASACTVLSKWCDAAAVHGANIARQHLAARQDAAMSIRSNICLGSTRFGEISLLERSRLSGGPHGERGDVDSPRTCCLPQTPTIRARPSSDQMRLSAHSLKYYQCGDGASHQLYAAISASVLGRAIQLVSMRTVLTCSAPFIRTCVQNSLTPDWGHVAAPASCQC